MAFARDEGKLLKSVKARVYHGLCILCGQPIRPGDQYIGGVGGSRTRLCGKAHWECYTKSPRKETTT